MNISTPIFMILRIAAAITVLIGWSDLHSRQSRAPLEQGNTPSPFILSVVPTQSEREPIGRRISMAKTSPGTFYVILTNTSKEPQAAFESWNSWGYQAVSFQVQTADGRHFVITKKQHDFTRNFPSPFIIPPGDHMVYPISLNHEWNVAPAFPIADATPLSITLKAVYEVHPTPEAVKGKVWTGRVESKTLELKLRHW